MLVLNRKTEQSILVDGNIKITILKVRGSQVQVGFEAPEDIRILRAELAPQDSLEPSSMEDPAATGQGLIVPR